MPYVRQIEEGSNVDAGTVMMTGAAGVVLVASQVLASHAGDSGELWTAMDLRACCTIGSVLGAFLMIGLLKDKDREQGPRTLAMKFFSSIASGVMFTPFVLRYLKLDFNGDNVIAVSGATALLAVGTLHMFQPYWDRGVTATLDRLFGVKPKKRTD